MSQSSRKITVAVTDSLFDFDAEADDLEEDMLDREYWARGNW